MVINDIRIRTFNSTGSYSEKFYYGNGDFQDNTWHHIVFVCDMANARGGNPHLLLCMKMVLC